MLHQQQRHPQRRRTHREEIVMLIEDAGEAGDIPLPIRLRMAMKSLSQKFKLKCSMHARAGNPLPLAG